MNRIFFSILQIYKKSQFNNTKRKQFWNTSTKQDPNLAEILYVSRPSREKNATRAAITRHKTCFILWCAIVARPKDLWRAMKKFWDITTKVAPKDDDLTDLVAESGKSAVKANISVEAYQFYLHQSPSPEVNYRKDSVCNMFSEGLFLLCRFRVEH